MAGKQVAIDPEIKQRARKTLRALKKAFPNATTELRWSNPLELLVATILSAQCTDERVNKVTSRLFKKYRKAEDYARASQKKFEEEIRAAGFYRQKAASIRSACQAIVEEFGSRVPDTMEDLVSLPGVARKTANVVLGTCFGKNEGIAVDTHVGRVAFRLGLVSTARNPKDADKVEQDLMQLIPKKDWSYFSHAVILHGRYVCTARKPKCGQCALNRFCPSAFTFD